MFPKTKSTPKQRFGTTCDIYKNEQHVLKVIVKELQGKKSTPVSLDTTYVLDATHIASSALQCDVPSDLVHASITDSVGTGMSLCPFAFFSPTRVPRVLMDLH